MCSAEPGDASPTKAANNSSIRGSGSPVKAVAAAASSYNLNSEICKGNQGKGVPVKVRIHTGSTENVHDILLL